MKQNADRFIHRQVSCRPKGSEFQSSSLQFAHSAQPYNDSSLPNSTESRTFRVVMVTKLTELALVIFNEAAVKHREKITGTLICGFASPLQGLQSYFH